MVPLEQISPDPLQPRAAFPEHGIADLAADLKRVGLQEPILVRHTIEADKQHSIDPETTPFVIVFGHRRTLAANQLGWETIEAFILDREHVGETAAAYLARAQQLQNSENEARENVTPLDLAMAFGKRVAAGMTKRDAAKSLGRSASWGTHAAKVAERVTPEFLDIYRRLYLERGQSRSLESLAAFLTETANPVAALETALADETASPPPEKPSPAISTASTAHSSAPSVAENPPASVLTADPQPPATDPIPSRRVHRQQRRESAPRRGRRQAWRVVLPGEVELRFAQPCEDIDRETLEALLDRVRQQVLDDYDANHLQDSIELEG